MKGTITVLQVAAILEAILEITGARGANDLNIIKVTKEQWREAYGIAGVPWTSYEEAFQRD